MQTLLGRKTLQLFNRGGGLGTKRLLGAAPACQQANCIALTLASDEKSETKHPPLTRRFQSVLHDPASQDSSLSFLKEGQHGWELLAL